MKIITKTEFLQDTNKKGLYAYVNGESCKLCERYLKELESFKATRFYNILQVVLLRDEHKHWMFSEQQVISTPLTRIFIDNLGVFQKGGILLNTQIEEFEVKLKEWNL